MTHPQFFIAHPPPLPLYFMTGPIRGSATDTVIKCFRFIITFHVCGAVSMPFFFILFVCLFCPYCSKLVVFESRLCGGKLVVLLPVWRQACSFVACVAVGLFCITPLGRQASSFVLRLCGGEKEKKERGRSFVACVADSLKFVVLYYACGAAS